jgi:hypothetical protein
VTSSPIISYVPPHHLPKATCVTLLMSLFQLSDLMKPRLSTHHAVAGGVATLKFHSTFALQPLSIPLLSLVILV